MGSGSSPPPVEFSFHHYFYKLSCSWLLGMCHYSCLLQLACLFAARMGIKSSPLSCGVFLPLSLLQAFPLLFAGHVLPLLPSSAGLLWGNSPSPLFGTQGTLPSLLCVFFVVIAYYSIFFLFSLGWGWSVQGPMLIWPRIVCGSTTCHLAHLVVCVLPSLLGTAIWWWCGSPPGFSI
jgi:hypothetical protein